MSYSSGRTWGDFHYVGQDAVFDSEAAVGGYKCKYCNIRMAKRWGTLTKHIETCHKEVTGEDLKELCKIICNVAVMFKYCNTPLKLSGFKLTKHINKCKTKNQEKNNVDMDTPASLVADSEKENRDSVMGVVVRLDQLDSIPVIHHDIKPENFLIKDGVVKLADFGLSYFGTVGYGRNGTPGYQAPEDIKKELINVPYTNQSDMWSLGVTLYEVIVGEWLIRNLSGIRHWRRKF